MGSRGKSLAPIVNNKSGSGYNTAAGAPLNRSGVSRPGLSEANRGNKMQKTAYEKKNQQP